MGCCPHEPLKGLRKRLEAELQKQEEEGGPCSQTGRGQIFRHKEILDSVKTSPSGQPDSGSSSLVEIRTLNTRCCLSMGRTAEVFFRPQTRTLKFCITRFPNSLFPQKMLPPRFCLHTREAAMIKHGNLFEKNKPHLFF